MYFTLHLLLPHTHSNTHFYTQFLQWVRVLILHKGTSDSISSHYINLSLTATRSVDKQACDWLVTAEGSPGSHIIGINHLRSVTWGRRAARISG